MADLDPQDIKEPEEAPPPIREPDEEPVEKPAPNLDEDEEDEAAGKWPDVAALVEVVEHLTTAVAELARSSGSPPAVVAAIERVRQALGK
jgi:hypothetical protein